VPHDVGKVVELLGGEETFLKRLDFFHTSGLADIGNEPVFLTVFMPHYAGRPALSAERVHYCEFLALAPKLCCNRANMYD
jgi:putative alpha-1,2-mannosidase